MSTATLLVEIGTEELPPRALESLGLAFRDGIVQGLAERELQHGDVQWFATPRRLAVLIDGVALQAPEKTVETLGPPADRARDAEGNWTPAAAGFAKKQNVAPEELQTIDTPKGPRLGLRSTVTGINAADCLNEVIRGSVQALPIPKRMRWGASREEFVRPVHWVSPCSVTLPYKERYSGNAPATPRADTAFTARARSSSTTPPTTSRSWKPSASSRPSTSAGK